LAGRLLAKQKQSAARRQTAAQGKSAVTRSLRKQAKNDDEVDAVDARFRKVWAKADVQITSSCLCQPGK
jgi:hypothetical protein